MDYNKDGKTDILDIDAYVEDMSIPIDMMQTTINEMWTSCKDDPILSGWSVRISSALVRLLKIQGAVVTAMIREIYPDIADDN